MYSVHLRTLDKLRFTTYQNITGHPVFYGEQLTLHGVENTWTGDEKKKKIFFLIRENYQIVMWSIFHATKYKQNFYIMSLILIQNRKMFL